MRASHWWSFFAGAALLASAILLLAGIPHGFPTLVGGMVSLWIASILGHDERE
jgi:hypothetical protein